MRKFCFILCSFFLLSCQDQKDSAEAETARVDTSAFSEKLNVTTEEVQLVPEARELASQWVAYITAQNEINNLKDSSINQVIENSGPLAQIMQSLKTSLPDTLRTKSVEARLNVLVTKAQVLDQLANQRQKHPDEIAKTAKQIPLEFHNFKLQLNEIFLKTIEDFEEELDEFDPEEIEPKTDSLQQTSG